MTDVRAYRTAYEAAWMIFGAVAYFMIAVVLFYGVLKSIKDTVTPRVAARIMISIVGLDILGQVTRYYLSLRNLTPIRESVFAVSATIDLLFILSVIWFFYSKKTTPSNSDLCDSRVEYCTDYHYLYRQSDSVDRNG